MWKDIFKKNKGLIIISSAIFATALVIILIMGIIKVSREKAGGEDGSDTQVVSEETAANGAAGDEDMPVVETATEGTKTESTADTTVLAKKEGAKDGYLNRCVFLGDSRTVAMVNYGFFNDDAALAQIGISHPSFASNKFINNAGKEYTLKTYLGSHQAPVIYILLGVNGINGFSEDKYKSTFISLIDSVADMAPNSNIVLVSIGPVDDNGIYKNSVQNAWINKYNDFLLETAREKHIFYLDIAEILKGSDGQVKSEYNGGDGLHYSGKGCEAIFRYIVEHPVPGISDEGTYVVKYIKPDPNRLKATISDDSGIDEGNLQDLMDMMMGIAEEQTASEASTQASDEAASEGSSFDEEEAKRKAEEEAKKKAAEEEEARKKAAAEEEAKKKAAAEEEARKKAAAEEEARRKAEEEEARRKAEEEASKESSTEASDDSASKASSEEESADSASSASTEEADDSASLASSEEEEDDSDESTKESSSDQAGEGAGN